MQVIEIFQRVAAAHKIKYALAERRASQSGRMRLTVSSRSWSTYAVR